MADQRDRTVRAAARSARAGECICLRLAISGISSCRSAIANGSVAATVGQDCADSAKWNAAPVRRIESLLPVMAHHGYHPAHRSQQGT